MDLDLFLDMLREDSTSGKEGDFARFLSDRLTGCSLRRFEVGDGTQNLLFTWGKGGEPVPMGMPSLLFCTHLDTVPPYIPPRIREVEPGDELPDGSKAVQKDILITGRGSCDAKGQIFSMFTACQELAAEGFGDFGLLLLSGEETGSSGAKAFTRDCPGGPLVVVGEPTDNKVVSASKGTKSFEVVITGKACHSGYPHLGDSAVERFVDFMNAVRAMDFPDDPLLGPTTWNVGKLVSDNPQNVLSPLLKFRIYFRTTFSSDSLVQEKVTGLADDNISVIPHGGDSPMRYCTWSGIPSTIVAFGSDAPQLEKFASRALCGPGSIAVAHTDKEYILVSDMEKAVENYRTIACRVLTDKVVTKI